MKLPSKIDSRENVKSVYSVPGSVLRASPALTILKEQSSQGVVSGSSEILTLTTDTRAQFVAL